MKLYPDGSHRFVAVSQGGTASVIVDTPNVSNASVILDLSDKISFGSESGLLGCAFDPLFIFNHYIYFSYTELDTNSKTNLCISRFIASGSRFDTILRSTEQSILKIPLPTDHHHSGCLCFGPDGYLYIGCGDGGLSGDPTHNAQNLKVLLGKILRIDVASKETGYAIPSTNPFSGDSTGIRQEIYAYGFRNPWRFSFDTKTGTMWCGDVGETILEEIDTIEAGKNYGWNIMEGSNCFVSDSCDKTGLTMPIWDYKHDTYLVAVIGGNVYRGKKLPQLQGKYIFADLSGIVWALTPRELINIEVIDTQWAFGLTGFCADWNGELIIISPGTGRFFSIDSVIPAAVTIHNSDFQIKAIPTVISKQTSSLSVQIQSPLGERLHFDLADALGKEISLGDYVTSSEQMEYKLDLDKERHFLTEGLYFLRVNNGLTVHTIKLIIQ
ncbi:MAG TPA: PQQ-dependent sugar dehydrogenase [Candidatus Kapabacteria bacterium]|nr:PQQ-dependent sugar dehydrogenase [Candidatus Kapabacteria bacterium]